MNETRVRCCCCSFLSSSFFLIRIQFPMVVVCFIIFVCRCTNSIHPPTHYTHTHNTHANQAVFANGESTDLSIGTDKYSVIGGKRAAAAAADVAEATHQISGSSSLQKSGNNKQTRRRKNNHSTTRKPNFDALDDDYDDTDEYSHGILITEPHPVPPPFDPSFRVIGGVRVPGIEAEVYGSRKHGERHGDVDDNWKTWDRFDAKADGHGHSVGTNYASVMHPDGDFMQMPSNDETEPDDRQDDQPCTLGCLNSEYLCPHSCQCVPKFTRCNGELNCEFGEDEEECGGKCYPIRIFPICETFENP